MSRIRHIAMIVGTFSVALGIGFVMQNGDALASRFGLDAPDGTARAGAEGITQALAPAAQSAVMRMNPALTAATTERAGSGPKPALPDTGQRPTMPGAPVRLAAIETDMPPKRPGVPAKDAEINSEACPVSVAGTPEDAAIVSLRISAPCHAGSPLILHHQGLRVSARADAQGAVTLDVPALAPTAVFVAAFPDGASAVGTVRVPDTGRYDRAVLQWRGVADVMLSAYEFGAGFGEAGHIYRGNTADAARAITGEGGVLMRLGDAAADESPHMAEVYTFPSGQHDRGDIALVAEAGITAGNCGAKLAAQSIQIRPDGTTEAQDMTLRVPGCEAAGDFLYLQGMFEDLKLAAR